MFFQTKKTARHFLLLIGLLGLMVFSCKPKGGIVYSDNHYEPLPKVTIEHYKTPQLRAEQNPEKALGLAISGGGSRAEYFSLGVLIGLDHMQLSERTFLEEVDYVSSVSGGGFGIGYYLTLKHHGVLNDFDSFFDYWESDIRKNELSAAVFEEAKAASILKLRKYEMNRLKNPHPNIIDDQLLQVGKRYKDRNIERLYLRDFFIPKNSERPVTLPMFVPNGTIYVNGERLPFMPHILDSIGIKGSLLPNETFEAEDNFGFPLNYAIAGSAAFPGVLPMLKMTLKGKPNKVVRIIDGGAVDNLGFTTLFELLHSDPLNDDAKSMLIVDCSGLGTLSREQSPDRVKLTGLLRKSLLYTTNIKMLYSDKDIEVLSQYYNIDSNKVCRIGIGSIKEHYRKIEAQMSESDRRKVAVLREEMLEGTIDWPGLYEDFTNSDICRGYNEETLSALPASRFKEFTAKNVFELYELAAQVITRIKIDPWEKEILILAGRYTVHLKESQIVSIL